MGWHDRNGLPKSVTESVNSREATSWSCGCSLSYDSAWIWLCGIHEHAMKEFKLRDKDQ